LQDVYHFIIASYIGQKIGFADQLECNLILCLIELIDSKQNMPKLINKLK